MAKHKTQRGGKDHNSFTLRVITKGNCGVEETYINSLPDGKHGFPQFLKNKR